MGREGGEPPTFIMKFTPMCIASCYRQPETPFETAVVSYTVLNFHELWSTDDEKILPECVPILYVF